MDVPCIAESQSTTIRRAVAAVAALVAILSCEGPRAGAPSTDDTDTVQALFESRRSNQMVEVAGAIVRILADDDDGSRHQRFILRLSNGQTLLVAHDIDLADRVPVARGDSLRVRGEYEWNEQALPPPFQADTRLGDLVPNPCPRSARRR